MKPGQKILTQDGFVLSFVFETPDLMLFRHETKGEGWTMGEWSGREYGRPDLAGQTGFWAVGKRKFERMEIDKHGAFTFLHTKRIKLR